MQLLQDCNPRLRCTRRLAKQKALRDVQQSVLPSHRRTRDRRVRLRCAEQCGHLVASGDAEITQVVADQLVQSCVQLAHLIDHQTYLRCGHTRAQTRHRQSGH